MKSKSIVLGMLVVMMLAGLVSETDAGKRRKKVVKKPVPRKVIKKRHHVARKVLKSLPAGHVKIVVGPGHRYYHRGVFYRHGPNGYMVTVAPRGARVKVLPPGYTTVIVGGVRYQHYYGAYYHYLDEDKVYVVVEPPVEAATADVITMVDGETLEGTFLGGDETTVDFEVDGEVFEIDLVDIVSITFEPPSDEEND